MRKLVAVAGLIAASLAATVGFAAPAQASVQNLYGTTTQISETQAGFKVTDVTASQVSFTWDDKAFYFDGAFGGFCESMIYDQYPAAEYHYDDYYLASTDVTSHTFTNDDNQLRAGDSVQVILRCFSPDWSQAIEVDSHYFTIPGSTTTNPTKPSNPTTKVDYKASFKELPSHVKATKAALKVKTSGKKKVVTVSWNGAKVAGSKAKKYVVSLYSPIGKLGAMTLTGYKVVITVNHAAAYKIKVEEIAKSGKTKTVTVKWTAH